MKAVDLEWDRLYLGQELEDLTTGKRVGTSDHFSSRPRFSVMIQLLQHDIDR